MPSTGSAPYPTAILLHGNGGNGAAMVTQFANELQGHILVGIFLTKVVMDLILRCSKNS